MFRRRETHRLRTAPESCLAAPAAERAGQYLNPRATAPGRKSFLVLFFKKEHLAYNL
jgi:hypothetical protein